MHIKDMDLNLLRLFDAVYHTRNVSRAAELLDLTQPAASQGLMRLRRLIHDPLFVRRGGGVHPSPKADQLADAVRQALGIIEQALGESVRFDPLESRKLFRIHMSDIGEARFLPDLMVALRAAAPALRLETLPVPAQDIAAALDSGHIAFAFGFLPAVKETERIELMKDRYVVLLREGHPLARKFRRGGRGVGGGEVMLEQLQQLDFVAVRTHSNTLRILQMLRLDDRLRLTTEHFTVLPDIVKSTDLAVVMPRNIARGFAQDGGYAIIEPPFALRDFTVSLHWSRRYQDDPGNRWLREMMVGLFAKR